MNPPPLIRKSYRNIFIACIFNTLTTPHLIPAKNTPSTMTLRSAPISGWRQASSRPQLQWHMQVSRSMTSPSENGSPNVLSGKNEKYQYNFVSSQCRGLSWTHEPCIHTFQLGFYDSLRCRKFLLTLQSLRRRRRESLSAKVYELKFMSRLLAALNRY